MSRKYSLHVGLNMVDKTRYRTKFRVLKKAESDTVWYYELSSTCGFEATMLVRESATAAAMLDHISAIAKKMEAGDLFFLTYSGHGARTKDVDGDEETPYDQMLVLYDRYFIDDEFKKNWFLFPGGCGIFFVTDSCYNGTVSKFFDKKNIFEDSTDPAIVFPNDPDFAKNKGIFNEAKESVKREHPMCPIIHIASCGDNQLANEGPADQLNSVFTKEFKLLYNDGNFSGNYRDFYDQLLASMPSGQTPNWDTNAGASTTLFETKSLFSI